MVTRLVTQARTAVVTALALWSAFPGCAFSETARVVTAADLAVLRDIDGLSLSPAGDRVVFQARRPDPLRNTYQLEWCITSIERADVRCFADGGEPILAASSTGVGVNGALSVSRAVWSQDGRWIAFLKQVRGRVQIWRSSVGEARAQQLTRNEEDVVAFVLSVDGRRLLFRTRQTAAQIAASLESEGRSGFRFDDRFAPAFSTHPLVPEVPIDERIWVYELRSSRERLADSRERSEFLTLLQGSGSAGGSGGVVLAPASDPSLQGVYAPRTITLESEGSSAVCSAPACTAQRFDGYWSLGDRSVAFIRREGRRLEERAVYLWRADEANSADLVVRTEGTLNDCQPVDGGLVCFHEVPTYPRRLALLRFDQRRVEILFDPNPWWSEIDIGVQPELLHIRAPSGAETHGYLVLPPRRGAQRLPLIIVTYRCAGFLRGGVGDEYPIFPFAAEGFAVLCFDAPAEDYERLARMSWSEYQNWLRGPGDPFRRRTQELLDAAVRDLSQRGVIDEGAVGLTGLSFGADTVKYALFNMPALDAAIASGAPMEPAGAFLAGRQGRELLRSLGLGMSEDARWDALSLARNASRVHAPLLLNVADHEMLSATQVYVALEDAGKPVDMYVFPDEYHIKWQPAHRLAIYLRNIQWMNFWLRDIEDPDPQRRAQYERWRSMRDSSAGGETEVE